MKQKFEKILNSALPGFTLARAGLILLGAAIASFGLYNIHQQSGITEGGVLGTVLLLHHWLGWPASVITPVLDISCYLLALKVLGTDFIKWSVASTLCVSGFFRLWECWPPMLPNLSGHPLLAAVLGALFVGIGVGLVVRQGGSSGGDDALALSISRLLRCRVSAAYLFTDLTVLLLSLSYIPFRRIAYSLVTVTVSSWLIDLLQGKNKNT
ncbi:MAG: YitT family protein [Candidatus Faecousia sp.]|nr:YitT family protein [Candidatus Faecousia sp.]